MVAAFVGASVGDAGSVEVDNGFWVGWGVMEGGRCVGIVGTAPQADRIEQKTTVNIKRTIRLCFLIGFTCTLGGIWFNYMTLVACT
jgi:hypothetical protein